MCNHQAAVALGTVSLVDRRRWDQVLNREWHSIAEHTP
jgi:hypothetical protein